VESFATKTTFSERPLDNRVPRKTIFINSDRKGIFPLVLPKTYLVYGKDVSYAGLETLASEIESKAPPDSKENAYKGLAVFYINDNWLSDLISDFKQNIVEDNIPGPYQHFFYSELTRKISNKYRNNPKKIKEIIDIFSGQKKDWMIDTQMPFVSEIRESR